MELSFECTKLLKKSQRVFFACRIVSFVAVGGRFRGNRNSGVTRIASHRQASRYRSILDECLGDFAAWESGAGSSVKRGGYPCFGIGALGIRRKNIVDAIWDF